MKSFVVLATLAACALAQRLHIQEPTTNQTVQSGQFFTVELEQDVSTSPTLVVLSPDPRALGIPRRAQANLRPHRRQQLLRRLRRPLAVAPGADHLQRPVQPAVQRKRAAEEQLPGLPAAAAAAIGRRIHPSCAPVPGGRGERDSLSV